MFSSARFAAFSLFCFVALVPLSSNAAEITELSPFLDEDDISGTSVGKGVYENVTIGDQSDPVTAERLS
ncbi:MAG: hypothetical protein AAF619_09815, partial [Pseudomonadota bacterium]